MLLLDDFSVEEFLAGGGGWVEGVLVAAVREKGIRVVMVRLIGVRRGRRLDQRDQVGLGERKGVKGKVGRAQP